MLLFALFGCTPVSFSGEIDGYEVEFAEAVFFELDGEDDETDLVAVVFVDFDDGCNRLSEYLEASLEAFDELLEATTEEAELDALEEMNEAEKLLPAEYWAAQLDVGVDSFGDGSVSGLQLRGADAEDGVESSGDAQVEVFHQSERPDWVECFTTDEDCAPGTDNYFSDGGVGEVTRYVAGESLSMSFESDYRCSASAET